MSKNIENGSPQDGRIGQEESMKVEKVENPCGGVAGGADIVHVSDLWNGLLDPMGFIGHVPEVNGGTSILIGSSMTVFEAFILLRHWREVLASIYSTQESGCVGSTDMRMEPYAAKRIVELESMVASVIQRLCDSEPRTGKALCDLRDIADELEWYFKVDMTISKALHQACARMIAIPEIATGSKERGSNRIWL